MADETDHMPPYKWAEMERRMMALEDKVGDLNQRVMTHDAVCLERQKSLFNVIATLDTRLQAVAKIVDDVNGRFLGWHTAIIGGMFLIIVSLVGVLWVHR